MMKGTSGIDKRFISLRYQVSFRAGASYFIRSSFFHFKLKAAAVQSQWKREPKAYIIHLGSAGITSVIVLLSPALFIIIIIVSWLHSCLFFVIWFFSYFWRHLPAHRLNESCYKYVYISKIGSGLSLAYHFVGCCDHFLLFLNQFLI